MEQPRGRGVQVLRNAGIRIRIGSRAGSKADELTRIISYAECDPSAEAVVRSSPAFGQQADRNQRFIRVPQCRQVVAERRPPAWRETHGPVVVLEQLPEASLGEVGARPNIFRAHELSSIEGGCVLVGCDEPVCGSRGCVCGHRCTEWGWA